MPTVVLYIKDQAILYQFSTYFFFFYFFPENLLKLKAIGFMQIYYLLYQLIKTIELNCWVSKILVCGQKSQEQVNDLAHVTIPVSEILVFGGKRKLLGNTGL